MMKTVSSVTKIIVGIVVVAVPYTVSAAMVGNEERQAAREASMEERKADRAAGMEERQAERETKMEERLDERQEKFCENFTSRVKDMESKLTERKGKFVDRKEKRVDYLDENRDTRDNMLTDKREGQDARRNAWYEKLETAADTDEKKAAVAEFKKTVEAAVETRRDSLNTAVDAFRKSVDAAATEQKENRAGGVDTFAAIVAVALNQVKTDCAAGKDAETIRSAFQSSLKSARDSLQSERKEGEKLGIVIKDLAETKKVAIQSALDAFKETLSKAKIDLKAAFGTGEVK